MKFHHQLLYIGLVVSLFAAKPALGQGANYENVVFGELATGMGGAAIGLSDEPSAAFFNPAGLVYLDTEILGLSVQAYGGTWMFVEEALGAGEDQVSLETSTIGSFPTSVAYSLPLGRIGGLKQSLALSVVAPLQQSYAFSQMLRSPSAAAEISTAASLRESELLGGISYAIGLGRLSLGATLFTEYASLAFENLLVAQGSDSEGEQHSYSRVRESSGSQIAVTGVLGAHLKLGSRWSLGMRVRLPNLALQSSSRHTFVESDRSGGVETSHIAVGGLEGSMRYRQPLGLGLGVGFSTRRIRFAMDAKGYLPMGKYALFDAPMQPASPPSLSRDWDPAVLVPASRLVVNLAVGAEIYATEGLSFLWGLNTNASSRPFDVSKDSGYASTMSFIGATAGLRTHGSAGTFTFSMVARQGAGVIPSTVWADGVEEGQDVRVEQASAMFTISWTRALAASLGIQGEGDQAP